MASLVPALPAARARPLPPLAVLSIASALSVAGIWLATPVLSVMLAARGAPAWQIGVLGAVPWLVALLVAPATPALARRAGGALALHRAAALACATALAGLALTSSWPAWLALAALFGAASCLVWTTADAMAAALSPPGREGRALGAYQAVMSAGIGLGPLVLAAVAPGPGALAAAAGLVLGGWGLSLALAEPAGAAPRRPLPARRRLVLLVALPAVMLAGTLSGALEAAAGAAFPLMGLELGFAAGAAAALAGIAGLGNVLAQVPAGWAADRFGTGRALAGAWLVLALAGLGVALAPSPAPFWLALMLWGGAAGAFVTIALVTLATRLSGGARATAIAALNAAYLLGGAAGAPLATLALAALPPAALPAALSALALLVVVINCRR